MTPRMILAALAMLSLTGCVAALPMAAQLVSGANSTAQLCSLAKMPGQTASLCERLPFMTQAQATPAAQTSLKSNSGATINTAVR
jgi:hypothetical protein